MIAAAWAWLSSRAGMIGGAVLAGLALLAALLSGARKAGRDSVRAETAEKNLEVRDAADRAGAAYRADGAERRLRDGTF